MQNEKLLRFANAWSGELSREGQEEYLLEPDRHEYLQRVWEFSPTKPDWLGATSIPNVRLVDCINSGALSLVCRGIMSDGSVVCVKVPSYKNGQPPELRTKLEAAIRNEAEVLASLGKHECRAGTLPGYVGSRSFCSPYSERTPYVITKYIPELTPLSAFLKKIDLQQAIRFFEMTCRLTQELHSHRIVHGDLHARNILADRNGNPVVLDLGSAQKMTRSGFFSSHHRRDFAPRLSINVHETLHAGSPLTPAFDVLCLAICIHDNLRPHYLNASVSICDIGPVNESDLDCGRDRYSQSNRLEHIHRESTWFEPEFRLQTAGELADAIAGIPSGPALHRRRTLGKRMTTFLRRNSIFILGLLFAFVSLGLVAWNYRNQVNAEKLLLTMEQDNNYQMTRFLSDSREVLASIRELLHGSVTRERLMGPQANRSGPGDRKIIERMVSARLTSPIVDAATASQALRLALELATANMELEGSGAISSIIDECVPVIRRFSEEESAPEFRLLYSEALALRSKCVRESELSGHDSSQTDAAIKYALEAARIYNSCDPNASGSAEYRSEFLRVGYTIGWDSLYAYVKGENKVLEVCHAVNALLDHALNDNNPGPATISEKYWYASLLLLRGLLRHKRVEIPRPHGIESSIATRADYARATEILSPLAETEFSAEKISSTDVKLLMGRIDSVSGMSLIQYEPRDLKLAVEVLERSFANRSELKDRFPGSLLISQQAMASGWNLADALTASNRAENSSELSPELLRQEIAARESVVRMAAEIAVRNPTAESTNDHRVNAIRLAYAYYLNGTPDKTVDVIQRLEGSSGIADYGGDHGNGFELIACLAVTDYKTSEVRYRKLLLNQVTLVHSRFVSYRNREVQHATVIREAARRIEDLAPFNLIRELTLWKDFSKEVHNRLAALSDE